MSQVKDKDSVVHMEKSDDEEEEDNGGTGYAKKRTESEDDDDDESEDDKVKGDAGKGNESESELDDDEEANKTQLEEIDETQLITPPSKRQKRATHICDEVPTTIQHYKAMLRTSQAQLKRAEQQIRAISKSSLVDKFMAGQVKQYVKQSLWKRCKFITCRETMEECMEEVADHFQITGGKREHWKSTYEHAVRDALNNRRNNTAQCLKKELTGTCPV